jgi:hypothetical protein
LKVISKEQSFAVAAWRIDLTSSGKENDDYIKSVAKKMKEYLKDGSKGDYETTPKHFPKGNGQLAKMDKMAYEIDDEGTDFNVEVAGQNIPDYDGKPPKKETIEKQIKNVVVRRKPTEMKSVFTTQHEMRLFFLQE